MFNLLTKRAFLPIFLTQFFGAFNDNAFKLAMLTLISYFISVSQQQSEQYQAIAGALFIIPFFMFSATAGQLADHLDKARLTRMIKVFEVVLVLSGSLALYKSNIILMLLVLMGLGVHSAFFGPIKYAILPDHLPRKSLLGATSLVEGSTFLAIFLGTTLGSMSIMGPKIGVMYAIVLTLIAALAGLIASSFIPATTAHTSNIKIDWRPIRATQNLLKKVLHQRDKQLVVGAISWFWLFGTVLVTKLPDYVNYVLHGSTLIFAFFLALFSAGFALGSLIINKILKGQISLRYVPVNLLLMSFFIFDLYWATPTTPYSIAQQSWHEFFQHSIHWRLAIDLLLLAICGGLFAVPLYAYLQITCDGTIRAQTIAANNVINALFMAIGTMLVMLLLHLQVTIPSVFLILAILNSGIALWLWRCLPKECHS